MGGILIVATAILLGWPLPLWPLQILYLNMISDVFPALALGVGPGDPDIMRRAPRDPSEPLMTRGNWLATTLYGMLIAVAVLAAFQVGLTDMGLPEQEAAGVAFLTLAFARLWHIFNMRDPHAGVFVNGITRNGWVWGALGLSIVLLLAAGYVPLLAELLHMPPLDARVWGVVAGFSVVPLVVVQTAMLVRKLARR